METAAVLTAMGLLGGCVAAMWVLATKHPVTFATFTERGRVVLFWVLMAFFCVISAYDTGFRDAIEDLELSQRVAISAKKPSTIVLGAYAGGLYVGFVILTWLVALVADSALQEQEDKKKSPRGEDQQ